jgi:hypothetical protein
MKENNCCGRDRASRAHVRLVAPATAGPLATGLAANPGLLARDAGLSDPGGEQLGIAPTSLEEQRQGTECQRFPSMRKQPTSHTVLKDNVQRKLYVGSNRF